MNFLEKKLEIIQVENEIKSLVKDMKTSSGSNYNEDYKVSGCIGKGGFGRIIKVQNKKGKIFAAKII